MTEIVPIEHYEKVNASVELYIKGYSYTQIAAKLGYTRKSVIEMVDDWKDVVRRDPYIRARALDTVNEAMDHYRTIKQNAWDVAERAHADDDRKIELSALTLAANITKQEFEHLKAAGIMQDEDITDKIVEIEEQKTKVIDMLRNSAPQLCDKDRRLIAEELSKLSGRVEVIPID
jgi:hypothetical protein